MGEDPHIVNVQGPRYGAIHSNDRRLIGLNNNELCTLLYCASALDEGTMAEAGFNLKIEPWKPGEEGCCRLKITKKQ